jgi:hypothetical protein
MYRRKDQEPFHSTMAQVTMDYPVDQVIPALNQMFTTYNTQPSTIEFAMLADPPIPYIFTNNSSYKAVDYKRIFKLVSNSN